MIFQGFVFDVDGVLVDSPHEIAWGETLDKLMQSEWADVVPLSSWSPGAYTTDVYQQFVSGKARAEGAASLLQRFHIPDPDGCRTGRLCELKQAMIAELIAAGRFRVFPDAARFLIAVRQAGCRTAVASSSLNAGAMLSVVRPHFVLGGSPDGPTMIELFDVDVCGRAFKPGKPHPKIFQAAIAEFGLRPADCVVVEDATSGVLAAKAAGAFCLGVARLGNDAALRECGADWAVESLDSVAVEAVKPQGGPPSAELRV